MNKRKTLRLTSILMALMMMFGLLSVLMVPWGTAGANTADLDVIELDGSADDTNRYIIKPTTTTPKTVTIEASRFQYNGDITDFEGLYIVIEDRRGVAVDGTALGSYKEMKKIDENTFSYDLAVTRSFVTGLYTVKIYGYKGKTIDKPEVPQKIAAFWLVDEVANAAGLANLQGQSGKWHVTAQPKIFAAAGSDIDLWWKTLIPAGGDGELRYVDPINKNDVVGVVDYSDVSGNKSGDNLVTYTIPTDTEDGKELKFPVLSLNKAGNFYTVQFAHYYGAASVDRGNVVTVDSLAPEVDVNNIAIQYGPMSGNVLAGYRTVGFTENFTFFEAFLPGSYHSGLNFVNKDDASKDMVSDSTSGLKSADSIEIYIKGAGASASPILFSYSKGDGDTGVIRNFDGTGAILKAGVTYKIQFDVFDNVGNKTTFTTGNIRVDAQYRPIRRLVAVTNLYDLVLGYEYTAEEIAGMLDIRVEAPTNPHFPNAYYLDSASLDTNYFDIEYGDTNTYIAKLTPKKVGETTGYVSSEIMFPVGDPSAQVKTNNIYFRISEPAAIGVTAISVSPKTQELKVGQTFTPVANVSPSNATNKGITWYSSNTAVATVNADTGLVTAVAEGEAWIYARSKENSGIQDDVKVYVGKGTPLDPTDKIGWVDEGGARYYYVDGKAHVGWKKIDGNWYFFDYTTAKMRAGGWLKEGGKWYYLNTNGVMKHDEWFKDTNGKWYWLKSSGAMAIGWEKIQGTWFYLSASGAMQTGWVNVRGIWYYMKASGAMYEGWLLDGGAWYYLTPGGGAMVTGTVTISGRKSSFATSGRWLGYV